jgi:pimeloyl-ACP methyl ester carboxylesterase
MDAVRGALGAAHVEVYGAGDGARIALAYAARYADRVRALVLDGGPRATLLSGDGKAEARALAKALGKHEGTLARLAARLRTRPLHAHGRVDDDVLARVAVRGDALVLAELPGAAGAALAGDPAPLARLVAAVAPPPGRQAAQARAADCHDDVAPAPVAGVEGGPFTPATWLRALGLAACRGWPAPSTPAPVLPAGRAAGAGRALVLAGDRAVAAPSAALRRVAGLVGGSYVRVRGAAALPALNDPDGCAGTIARRFLETRGRTPAAGCASRARPAPGVEAFPATLARTPAALRDAHARGRDRSTLADRRAATAAALTVADTLAEAEDAGAPARVAGLRGGSATVTRAAASVTLTLHGVRFVRDLALDGVVSHDTGTGSVYAAVTLRAPDDVARTFVLSWSTTQARGYAAARGSADGRSLLLVLPAP